MNDDEDDPPGWDVQSTGGDSPVMDANHNERYFYSSGSESPPPLPQQTNSVLLDDAPEVFLDPEAWHERHTAPVNVASNTVESEHRPIHQEVRANQGRGNQRENSSSESDSSSSDTSPRRHHRRKRKHRREKRSSKRRSRRKRRRYREESSYQPIETSAALT